MGKIDLPIPNGKGPKASVLYITVLFANTVDSGKTPLPHRVLTEKKIPRHHSESCSQLIGEYGGQVIKVTEESIIGSFSDAGNAVRSAIEIRQEFDNTSETERDQNQVYIKIAIHHGRGTVQAEDIFDNVLTLSEKMVSLANENEIYISQDVCKLAHDLPDVNFSPVKFIDKENNFDGINIYRINHCHQEKKQHLFSHQNALIRGNKPPCFYCGNRTHLTPECPSKNIPYIADSLEKAGYLSPEKLNKLFADYVSSEGSEANESRKESYSLAKDTFYEIKLIYQLRFFRAIWGWGNLDWEKLRKKKEGRKKSGPIWEAFDSLRSSNLHKAKGLLAKKSLASRKDHKLSIVLALIKIEENDFRLALRHLNHALDVANTKPQKIFILLLFARIYELTGTFVLAKHKLKEILLYDPECPEALYQTMVFEFNEQHTKKALSRLMMLVKKYKEYYIKALIDPDLAPFSRDIQPRLRNLFDEAKADADQLVPMAKKELGFLKKLVLYENERWLDNAHSLWDKIKDPSGSGSYLGYLDKILYATELLSIGKEVKEERKRNIRQIVYELFPPCEKYFTFTINFSYSIFVGKLPERLQAIHSELKEIEKSAQSDYPFKYKEIISRLRSLSLELNEIYSTLQKRYTADLLFQLSAYVLKFNLIFQGITLFIVFVGLPVLNHYSALFGVPGQEILAQNIGTLQKWMLAVGGMFWACISVVRGVKKMYGDQNNDLRSKSVSA